MKSKIEDDKIYTSKSLTEEMNEERIRQGKDELPEINPLRGGTSTLARQVMEQRAGLLRKGFQEEMKAMLARQPLIW